MSIDQKNIFNLTVIENYFKERFRNIYDATQGTSVITYYTKNTF